MSDPYQILGVSKTATQDEIKKAYRKLAKTLHPDLNPGNAEAEKKFKDLSHAFDQVGTPEARGKFDRGETPEQQQRQYEEHQKKNQSYHQSQQGRGRYSSNFADAFGEEDIFQNIFGGSRRRGGQDQFNFAGEDELYKLEVELKEAALGGEKVITLPNGKKLQVKIPAGIEEGKKLRFKGLGGAGMGSGAPGDAYVEIHIRPMEGFKRNGKDLETELPINIFEAVTGGSIPVKTLEGQVSVTIPPGVSSGSKLRVKGKGLGTGDDRGNLIVVIKVVGPKNPSEELVKGMGELQAKFNYEVRS
jgi:DnaJ-class molecular chaperone